MFIAFDTVTETLRERTDAEPQVAHVDLVACFDQGSLQRTDTSVRLRAGLGF